MPGETSMSNAIPSEPRGWGQGTKRSAAERSGFVCLRCQRTSEIERWVIIDAVERPDLLALFRSGKLYESYCPECTAKYETAWNTLFFRLAGPIFPVVLCTPS